MTTPRTRTTVALAALDVAWAAALAWALETVAREPFALERPTAFLSTFFESKGQVLGMAMLASGAMLAPALLAEPFLAHVWATQHLEVPSASQGVLRGGLRVLGVRFAQFASSLLACLPIGLLGLAVHLLAAPWVVAHDLLLALLATSYAVLLACNSVAGWAATLAFADGQRAGLSAAAAMRAVRPRLVATRMLLAALGLVATLVTTHNSSRGLPSVLVSFCAALSLRGAHSAWLRSLAVSTRER